jgi:hypothetical protein
MKMSPVVAIGLLCAAFAYRATAQDAATVVNYAPSPLLAIDQNRSTVVDRVVGQWGEALAQAGAGLTAEQLRELLAGLRADHLLAASLSGTLEGLRNVVATAVTSNAGVKANLLQAKALGDGGADLVYTPVTPCRLADTRNAGGQIGGNASRDFKVWVASGGFAAQGGSASNCDIPANPAAVAVNITAVTPSGAGNLIAYPTGTPSFSSVLNYQLGQNALANGAVVRTCLPNCANQLTIATNGAGVDVVVDIAGYFRAPQGGYVASVGAGTGIAVGGTATNPTVGIAAGGVGAAQLANNAVTKSKLSPAGGTAGQVLGTDGTNLQWQTVSGAGGGSIFMGNVGIGTATPASKLHVVSDSGQLPPRLESTGTSGFAAGFDFYLFGAPKGYVGVPDGSAAIAPGEMILYGGPGIRTSIWSGQTRAISMDGIGNVGIGTANPSIGRLHVAATAGTGVAGTSPEWVGVLGASTTFEGVRGESSSNGAAGVAGYSNSGTGIGTYGSSSGGVGIYGTTTSGTGVVGKSGAGSGVYGESSAASLTAGGVYGKNLAGGGIGVIGEASNGTFPTGVYGASTSSSGYGVYARNFAGRAIWSDGHAGQELNSGGFLKAALHVTTQTVIDRCYNSQLSGAAATTPPCGFTIVRSCSSGGDFCDDLITFPFNIGGRFVATSVAQAGGNVLNRGINVNTTSSNTLTVTLFATGENITSNYAHPFTIVIF